VTHVRRGPDREAAASGKWRRVWEVPPREVPQAGAAPGMRWRTRWQAAADLHHMNERDVPGPPARHPASKPCT
jgi:hypothetical protein